MNVEKKEKTIKQKSLWQEIWKNKAIYLIMLPGIIWFIVFSYGPMSGLQLAFKTYSMKQGIWGSPWCGLENFQYVFRDPAFLKSVGTTLWINAGRLIFQFPIPIILALLMNELRMKRYKKIVQTVLTFPQFLSWVIVASIAINVLSYDGLLNSLILSFGGETVNFTGNAKLFQPLLYITEMFVLQMGNMMSGGFDQIFNLSNPAVKDVSEILDMYIYNISFGSTPAFSFSTAVSFFRSVVNCIFLVAADRGAKALGGSGLFG